MAFVEGFRALYSADFERLQQEKDNAIARAHDDYLALSAECQAKREVETVNRLTTLNQYRAAVRRTLSELSESGSPTG